MFSLISHVDADYCSYSPALPVDFLFDFGSRTGSALVAQSYRGQAWIMDEVEIEGTTDSLAVALLDLCGQRGWALPAIGVYGDPAGRHPSSPTGVTDYETLFEIFRGYNVIWNQLTAPVPIVDTVNVTRRMLKSASGRISLFIHPRCKKLIQDIKDADWPAKNQLKEFHKLAALRYYLYKLFALPTSGVVGQSRATLRSAADQRRFTSRFAG